MQYEYVPLTFTCNLSAQMARDNTWLRSLLYAPSTVKPNPEPILPDLSSWPEEPAPIDKVMIGKHRSDICLADNNYGKVEATRISRPTVDTVGDGDTSRASAKKVKKAKVICILPNDSQGSRMSSMQVSTKDKPLI